MSRAIVVSAEALEVVRADIAQDRRNDGNYMNVTGGGLCFFPGGPDSVALVVHVCEIGKCGRPAVAFSGEAGDTWMCEIHDAIQKAP